MPSFQSYAGTYQADGHRVRWRCYATARVYEVRPEPPENLPPPPIGRCWQVRPASSAGPRFAWLVDAQDPDFSYMLLDVAAVTDGHQPGA